MNPRITLEKRTTPWGCVSWLAWVDGLFVGEYRLRRDAIKCSEAAIQNQKDMEDSLAEEINAEFGP